MGNNNIRIFDPFKDAADLHKAMSDEESCRYTSVPATKTVSETMKLLDKWTKGTEDTSWAVLAPDGAEVAGRVSYIPVSANVWEVAIMTSPHMRGKGLSKGALTETLKIMFNNFNARRIFADIDPDNLASLRLFEALGFKTEGRLRQNIITHIGVRDSVIMSLLVSD